MAPKATCRPLTHLSNFAEQNEGALTTHTYSCPISSMSSSKVT
jgi:hypothetical protein